MAGGFPIMRAYRPAPTSEPNRRVTITVFGPAPLNTRSQRAIWIHESKEWSRVLAQTIERRQQHQLKSEAAQDRANYQLIIRQQAAQDKAQAEYDEDVANQTSLAYYKRVWSVSLFGLLVSGFLFLILFTTAVRDTVEARLGVITACDLVPSLTDGSKFSTVWWAAVAVENILKPTAVMAVVNIARMSKALHEADAAYYERLNEYSRLGVRTGAVMAANPLAWGLFLVMRGECDGEICLNLVLATGAVTSWTFLASITWALFLESGYKVMVGQWKRVLSRLSSKDQREAVGKSGWELLGRDEKGKLEWVRVENFPGDQDCV
ncbi:MAG: hypothetical protein ALECFALPRED_007603 [Alectoria fallacina]|uniref:Uncharacterized protein n=1 Tax=Alectoria fallacina TaxID=1903189 RepID=A0A8H3G8Y6_9LECA|nr:MAG: hypothetical protein ALECFALPRED_007603 [Alectoria fallacina]